MPTPLPPARAGGLQRFEDRGADAVAAPFRQQRDVDDVQPRCRLLEIEPAGRHAAVLEHVERAAVNVGAVVMALRLELADEEGLLLLRGPGDRRQSVPARRGVEPQQERDVVVGFRPQREALRQQRRRQWEGRRRNEGRSGDAAVSCASGKMPNSAMQKFSTR